MPLPTTNRTVSIHRLNEDNDIRDWGQIDAGVEVHINQIGEELIDGIDGQPSFFPFRMMTDGEHEDIEIGDRITDDNSVVYTVRGKAVHDSIVGESHQYTLAKYFT